MVSLSELAGSVFSDALAAGEQAVGITPGGGGQIAPAPDVSYQAATPNSSFISSAKSGASPWIIVGVIAVVALIVLKKV